MPANGGNTFGKQNDVPGYTMRGTLERISNATLNSLGAYLMQSDNRWYPAPANVEKAYVPPFRCYLLQKGTNGARILDTTLNDSVIDQIDTIHTIDADGSENVYDLSGRRVGSAKSGIFIKNGKKVVIKK